VYVWAYTDCRLFSFCWILCFVVVLLTISDLLVSCCFCTITLEIVCVSGNYMCCLPPPPTHTHTHTHKWNNRDMRSLEFDLRPVRAGLVVVRSSQGWDSFGYLRLFLCHYPHMNAAYFYIRLPSNDACSKQVIASLNNVKTTRTCILCRCLGMLEALAAPTDNIPKKSLGANG